MCDIHYIHFLAMAKKQLCKDTVNLNFDVQILNQFIFESKWLHVANV